MRFMYVLRCDSAVKDLAAALKDQMWRVAARPAVRNGLLDRENEKDGRRECIKSTNKRAFVAILSRFQFIRRKGGTATLLGGIGHLEFLLGKRLAGLEHARV